MKRLVEFQISVSTAQEEANYSTNRASEGSYPDPDCVMPGGSYRVIDGQFFRVVSARTSEESRKKNR